MARRGLKRVLETNYVVPMITAGTLAAGTAAAGYGAYKAGTMAYDCIFDDDDHIVPPSVASGNSTGAITNADYTAPSPDDEMISDLLYDDIMDDVGDLVDMV